MPVIVTCRWILLLFFLIIPFLHPFVQNKDIVFIPFLSILFCLTLFLALREKEKRQKSQTVFIALLAYMILISLSVVNTDFVEEFLREYLFLLGEVIVFFAVFFVFRMKAEYSTFIALIVFCAALVSLLGILQHYNINFVPRDRYFYFRITSTFTNPNDLAGYLLLALPLAFFVAFQAKNVLERYFHFTSALVIYAGIILASSRGSWVALLSLVFVCCLLHWRKTINLHFLQEEKKMSFAFLIGFIFITVFYSMPSKYTDPVKNKTFVNRLADSKDILTPVLPEMNEWAEEIPLAQRVVPETPQHGGSVYHRYYMWRIAVEMIYENPLLGVGFGTYGYNYPVYGEKVRANDKSFPMLTNGHITEFMPHAHNEVLNVFAEAGIFALLAFIAFFLYLFKQSIVFLQKSSSENIMVIALTSSILVLLFYAMFSYPLRVLTSAFVFWALAGLLLSITLRNEKN